MAKNTRRQIQLLEAVINSVKQIGEHDTISALKKANSHEDNTETHILTTIINNTCKVYKISKNELFNGKLYGERTYALGACCYLIRHHLVWSFRKIALYFDKQVANMHRYYMKNEELNPKIKSDAELIDKLFRLEEIVKQEIDKTYQNG